MMGLAKMAPDGWRYYAEEVGLGREDYFAGHGEEPGRWAGRGAESVGLSGVVSPEQLSKLFGEGRHPVTRAALGRPFADESGGKIGRDAGKERQGGVGQVAGYALSFSPPKSVSLLWALADEAVSAEVRRAHDAAVGAALEFLQDHAAFTRRGHAGAVQADTDGYVAAAFTHRTSRARDPQLHTHVLVSAKVRASTDGRWLALDGRELFEVQKAAGLIYKAGLRAELSTRLGVGWGSIDANGGAEIEGVPEALVEHFSTRRAQVEARAAQLISEKEAALGRSLNHGEQAAAYQLAAYQSRAGKARGGETTAELRARWRAEAVEAGHGPYDWLGTALPGGQLKGRSQGGAPYRPRKSADAFIAEAIEAIERGRSTWGRADVVEELAVRIAPHIVPTAERVRDLVDRAADELLADRDVVPLGPQTLTAVPAPEELRRRDGLESGVRHGAARYTTWRSWHAEQAVLEAVEAGRGAGVSVVTEGAVEAATKEAGLGDDQAEAVRQLCLEGERVSVLVGPAGSGKSRGLGAARAAWQSAGFAVRGVAPSAVAAGALAEQAHIPSETLAKFLIQAGNGRIVLQRDEIIVCDEASMVSTRDLAALVALVERAGAKLVLAGDHHQLGAVEAGGLFRLLVADARTAELSTVRRFSDPWEAEVTRRLRDQDASVIAEYEAHGRVLAGSRSDALDAAHEAWLKARSDGRSVVVMAADHATVDQLAMLARAARVAAGEVEEVGSPIGNQVVGVGDEVVTTKNDRRLVTNSGAWVRNGDRWQVLGRRPDGSLLLASLDGRGKVNLPCDYVRENVALAYGMTVHKAQGLTTDEAVLVVDRATTAEHLYVGLTRGRMSNLVVVVTEPLDDGHRHFPAPIAHDVLAAALGHNGAEQSATEAVCSVLSHSQDVGVLRAVLADALRRMDDLAGHDRSGEIELLQRKMGGDAQDRGPTDDKRMRAFIDAQRARSEWLDAHPEVVSYVLDLARRVRGEELRRALGGPVEPRVDRALIPWESSPEL
jgi:conjugative relaxase-like TrwC/TraI family protein